MISIVRSAAFAAWLHRLEDQKGRARILARIAGAALGNFGDCAPVGAGISEMRIHYGPGYRVYFVREGTTIYVLLCGGTKRTQKHDIQRAKQMAREWQESRS